MKFSIIICTYNRAGYIYNVLKSVAENDFPCSEYEIVLVNNNSTDSTETECKRFCTDFQQVIFRYFVETNQGLSYARNRGIKESYGDILVYIDDDATVNRAYLQTYADFFASHPFAMAAGGAILPVYETEAPKWMSHYTKNLITGYLYCGNKFAEFKNGKYPGGGNVAYRADVFHQIGVFNVDLGRKGNSLIGAEEKDVFDKMSRLKMKFYYLPNAILYHIIPPQKLTKDYFNRLTLAIGKSERIRTRSISKKAYHKRLLSEAIKWAASLMLFAYYTATFRWQKGIKLLLFRKNVTQGLLYS
ncbi:glycosyl transferase [Candidatus Symbiothrix dinenymphae]|nr:glycosyl transferase [Candidatus Symbiothrix dinenymphae]